MTSLREFQQKQQKELELFNLKKQYNTVFEYQDMMILSVIYGIVETIAIRDLYLVVIKMLEEKSPYKGGMIPINNYSELIQAIENLTIHIVGDSDKHYKVRFINCDKMWNNYYGHQHSIYGNLWIRAQIPDIYSGREELKKDMMISLLIERGDIEY